MPVRLTHVYLPGGVNLKMPDTLRNITEAADGLNFDILSSGHLVKRKGYMQKADHNAGFGLTVYEKRTQSTISVSGWGAFAWGVDEWGSPTTLGAGSIDYKLVGLASIPLVWAAGTVEVETTNADDTRGVRVYSTSGQVNWDIVDSSETVVTANDVGTGIEASPVTVATVASTINGLSGWTASVTAGTSTIPAAFADREDDLWKANTPKNINFGEWTAVNTTLDDPMPATESKIDEDDYENADACSMNGVLYINNGFDPAHKYDGQTFYYAGLPKPATPTVALSSGTTATSGFSGSYTYKVTYVQVDAIGNIIEGDDSDSSAAVDNSSGGEQVDVTITNLDSDSGYNTNCAIAQGTQTSTNTATSWERLTVDDGSSGAHTMKVGDTAYFYDKNASAYTTYPVVAVATNTITLESGSTISVDDNIVISNNLRVGVWRTAAAGTTYNLIEEIPNDSFNSTQVYTDNTADASLGADLLQPDKSPGLPPECRYCTVWRNQLILAGDPSFPTRIYYSEAASGSTNHDNPENFPSTNFIEIGQGGGGRITGLGVIGRNLVIFMADRLFIAEGNLALDQIRVDLISDNVGCVAHHTIQALDNKLIFLSRKGVYAAETTPFGMDVKRVSEPLDPIFAAAANNDFADHERRATATVWPDEKKYILFMPSESTNLSKYADSDSRIYVWDDDRRQWYIWDTINAAGGIVTWNDGNSGWLPWWHSREDGPKNRLYRMSLVNTEIDYADHTDAVNMSYRPQWEFLPSPRSKKIYTEIAIDAFIKGASLAYTPTGTVTVQFYKDFDSDTLDSSLTFDYQSDDNHIIEPLRENEKRSIAPKYSNTEINKQILISGWSFEAIDRDRSIKRL